MRIFLATIALALALLLPIGAGAAGEDWQSTISHSGPGPFPEPRPMHCSYRFGWTGIIAATGDVRLSKPLPERFQLDAVMHTMALARTLWKFDVTHTATAEAKTLHPIAVKQVEETRAKKTSTDLLFDANGVTGKRTEGKKNPKTRRFDMTGILDLHSAFLYLRSHALKEHDIQRIVVYPGKDAYVATLTVVAREKITIPAGTYPAIKLDLQLSRVGKNGTLEGHKKFRTASIWISDDEDRLFLRAEAQIFIGTVFAELQSIEFDAAKQ
ncbi:MAG: DUF3108 domain-containing protein [Chthoniobacterales bacterium]